MNFEREKAISNYIAFVTRNMNLKKLIVGR